MNTYRGVNRRKKGHLARVDVDGKKLCFGTFEIAEEAAKVRDRAAYKLLGPNAFLNFELSQAEKDKLDSITKDEFIKQVKIVAEEGNLTRRAIHASSRFRGVTVTGKKWTAQLQNGDKKLYLGSYKSEEEAAAAYDQALLKRDGPQALTNAAFPTLLTNEALERRLEMQAQRKKKMADEIDTTHNDDGGQVRPRVLRSERLVKSEHSQKLPSACASASNTGQESCLSKDEDDLEPMAAWGNGSQSEAGSRDDSDLEDEEFLYTQTLAYEAYVLHEDFICSVEDLVMVEEAVGGGWRIQEWAKKEVILWTHRKAVHAAMRGEVEEGIPDPFRTAAPMLATWIAQNKRNGKPYVGRYGSILESYDVKEWEEHVASIRKAAEIRLEEAEKEKERRFEAWNEEPCMMPSWIVKRSMGEEEVKGLEKMNAMFDNVAKNKSGDTVGGLRVWNLDDEQPPIAEVSENENDKKKATPLSDMFKDMIDTLRSEAEERGPEESAEEVWKPIIDVCKYFGFEDEVGIIQDASKDLSVGFGLDLMFGKVLEEEDRKVREAFAGDARKGKKPKLDHLEEDKEYADNGWKKARIDWCEKVYGTRDYKTIHAAVLRETFPPPTTWHRIDPESSTANDKEVDASATGAHDSEASRGVDEEKVAERSETSGAEEKFDMGNKDEAS